MYGIEETFYLGRINASKTSLTQFYYLNVPNATPLCLAAT